MSHSVLEADGRDPIGRVFLADAAEVDLHSRTRQADRLRGPLDLAPADERDGGGELRGRRKHGRVAPEIPDPAQNPGGDVEQAAAQSVALVRIAQERRGLRVDRDFLAAGGAIDARRHAVVAVARVLRLDAHHVGDGRVRGAARAIDVGSRELDLVLRGHGAEGLAEELHK